MLGYRRIDTELVRNLSVKARGMIVAKVIEECKTRKEAAIMLGVSRQALFHYLKDEYQPSDGKILQLLPMLKEEVFHDILLKDLQEYITLVGETVGKAKVNQMLSGLFTSLQV